MKPVQEQNPQWIHVDKRHAPVGIRLSCPLCNGTQIAILFLNPPDHGPSAPNDDKTLGNNGGKRWARQGLTFEEMSLHPSIDATAKRENYPEGPEGDTAFLAANRPCTEGGSNHWHGFLLHGMIQ